MSLRSLPRIACPAVHLNHTFHDRNESRVTLSCAAHPHPGALELMRDPAIDYPAIDLTTCHESARMRGMSWRTRASVAAVLAIAFATTPVVLDQCAASCDLARALEAAGSMPTCHDAAGSTTARIGHARQACGHDHGATVTILTAPPTPVTRALAPVVAAVTSQASDEWATATSFPGLSASPPHDPLSRHLSVSLRI
jgi:hypothetical protein